MNPSMLAPADSEVRLEDTLEFGTGIDMNLRSQANREAQDLIERFGPLVGAYIAVRLLKHVFTRDERIARAAVTTVMAHINRVLEPPRGRHTFRGVRLYRGPGRHS